MIDYDESPNQQLIAIASDLIHHAAPLSDEQKSFICGQLKAAPQA